MCQLLGLSAAAPLTLRFSWKRFAMRGSAEAGNPDGWGVAYQAESEAYIVREPTPASDSPLVAYLGEHGPASDLVVSHVRRATVGRRSLANTQPFVRRLGGRAHIFAHNGYVPNVAPGTGAWLRPTGETDSELLFCALLERLAPLWEGTPPPPLAARKAIVAGFAEECRERGACNFLYSDGLALFVHAHRKTIKGENISTDPGLYLLDCARARDASLCDGVDCERPGDDRGDTAVAMVATVPLDDQPWRAMGHGELLVLERGRVV